LSGFATRRGWKDPDRSRGSSNRRAALEAQEVKAQAGGDHAHGRKRWRGRKVPPKGSIVADFAFEAGFGDLGYFNRSFRQRCSMRSSDVRGTASAEKKWRQRRLVNSVDPGGVHRKSGALETACVLCDSRRS